MKKILFILLFVSQVIVSNAQLAGNSVFSFLNLTNSARVASLGGNNISLHDNDLNFAFHNPALLDSSLNNSLVMNYVGYFAGVKFGYVSYARSFKKIGNIAAGVHYINYGDFIEADAIGNITGSFKCAEYAINLIWSKQIDSLWSVGVNTKPVISNLESYSSTGLVFDAGVNYFNPKTLFSASITLRNAGWQLSAYHEKHKEPVAYEILAGVSKKLAHAPFRFSATYTHLEHWNLDFENTNLPNKYYDPFTGQRLKETKIKDISQNLLRHFIIGVEFIPLKSFYFNLGYNFRRRLEMGLEEKNGAVGLSWGFGLNLKRFRISYGRATYHIAGGSNHFSISTNLNNFKKK